MRRIAPSVRMKEEVTALLGGEVAGDTGSTPMEGFVRATARYMLQVAIEAEASAFLGRGHYRRGAVLSQAGRAAGHAQRRSGGLGAWDVRAWLVHTRRRGALRGSLGSQSLEQEHGEPDHPTVESRL